MYAPCEINEHPRTKSFIEKCEEILFGNLRGTVSASTEQFLASVHKQMVKCPERFPTEKQATVIDRIHNDTLDEMAREGRYEFYMLPLRHRDDPTADEADAIVDPVSGQTNLRIHPQCGS